VPLKELAYEGLAKKKKKKRKKKKKKRHCFCSMYDFSVAFISALAFLKYVNLRLTVVV